MAIKHEPKFYVKLAKNPVNFVGNFRVYPGSIYGRCTDVAGAPIFWVCEQFNFSDSTLPVHVFDGTSWKLSRVPASHPCYKWVKSAIHILGFIPNVDVECITFEDTRGMMKHYSLHKKGSGARICTNQINPVLRWNEVTETAHWYGKGNASVVASNIK